MPNQIDESFENFQSLETIIASYAKAELSESDTRSKLLDFLIISILGWKEEDILREGYVSVGYFDYEIRTSGFTFIVEAKKQLVAFSLPAKGNQVKLKTIYTSNKEVIDQIRGYIFERGLQYGIITNGTQFIIANFVSHTGNDWKDNMCVYYKSITDVKENFVAFYNLLSKDSINKNGRIKINIEQLEVKVY
ncbi:MAG: hypothetical protein EOO91_04785 [Pedobacter sp.]|nr:MAG: hypothetical protein EOO91_04785 [Pedobacter sp.]